MKEAGTRKQRDRERHQNELVEGAVRVFFETGYHQATVQEIAQKAEFGVGTLYRLFPDGKEGLFRAMQERVVAAFEGELAAAMENVGDERDAIRRYVTAAVRAYDRHPREMAIYMKHIAGVGLDLSKGLPLDLAARYLACVRTVSGAIRDGMAKGLFRKMPVSAASLLLRAVINTWLMGRLEGLWDDGPEKTVDRILGFFFNGLAAGGAA